MHHANHFYGHAHIMGRFVGADYAPRIWGYLQHGWNMHDGFAVGTVFAPRYPKFVWSHACARRGWAAGLREYMVVGSPWLYLLELERQEDWIAAARPRTGTIVYPFHGWEGQQVLGSHSRYLDQIRATEGDVPITVCLHWNEFDNDKVREEYEAAGVRVITHGQRGYMWKGTDQAFLYRQLDEMRHHRRVISNRMSSAILYAASAGIEVGVYGDPMHLESDHAVLGGVSKPRRMWPEMHQESIPTDLARQVADDELGRDDLLLPEEVIDAFGWTPELGPFPGPPPPGPSLDFDQADMRRQSRKAARNSHRGPADAEQAPQGPGLLDDLLAESPSPDGRAAEDEGFDDQSDGNADRGADADLPVTPGAPTSSGPTAV
jgi:hypothetical protein